MRSSGASAPLMALFSDVGRIYVAELLLPTWDRFDDGINARKAFGLFCRKYAFERVGAPLVYPLAAEQAIARAGRDLEPGEVWSSFCDVVDGPVNEKTNPLWHRDHDCDCLLCIFRAETGPRNIVDWARQEVAHGRVAAAYTKLLRVRGVGPKIASFFLRDVALRYGLSPEADRWLLQPVDVWVRRFVMTLEPGHGTSDDRAVAGWVVTNSVTPELANATPELANAGLWYFGARIAPGRLDYTKALTEPDHAEDQVQRHINGMDAAVKAWKKSRRND
jgi:hypothetical protein